MKKKSKKHNWAGKILHIFWKHIAKGEPHIAYACPIALALREQGARDIEVTTAEITIGNKSFAIPEKASSFVDTFDSDRTVVKPFSFKIGKLLEDEEDEKGF